jgi:hypothetical protein
MIRSNIPAEALDITGDLPRDLKPFAANMLNSKKYAGREGS